ncbi:MAG: NAD-dependent epimerase/dehydratase family protein [Candidatus Magnetomorum sp.]|nr:NAD-dependent epimerase/dehydratase family protein [Candidatus Magnetomorum sp.]
MQYIKDTYRPFFQGKSIVITGASGYIASNLIAVLKTVPCKLFLHSRSATAHNINHDSKAEMHYVFGELCDKLMCEQLVEKADIIYHLAGQTSIYQANDDPEKDYIANVLPMRLLLEACRNVSQKVHFIFTGTSTQCGLPKSLPVDESHPDHPITLYDTHKLMAEKYLSCYTDQNWIKGVTLRLTNIYGPGPKSSALERNVISRMIQYALQEKPLTVYGKGNFIRDYLFIDDLINALLIVAVNSNKLRKTAYVLGSGQGNRLKDTLNMISKIVYEYTQLSAPVIHISPPESLHAIESRNFVAGVDAFSKDTGWHVKNDFESGLRKTIRFFINMQKESL